MPLLDAAAVAAAKRAAAGRTATTPHERRHQRETAATDETVLTLDDIGGGGGVAVRFVEIVGLADAFGEFKATPTHPKHKLFVRGTLLDGRRGCVICFDQAKQMFSVMLPPQTDAAAATTTSEGKSSSSSIPESWKTPQRVKMAARPSAVVHV